MQRSIVSNTISFNIIESNKKKENTIESEKIEYNKFTHFLTRRIFYFLLLSSFLSSFSQISCSSSLFFISYSFPFLSRRAILGNPDVMDVTQPWYQLLYNDFWGTPLVDSGSHGSYRPFCVLSYKLNFILGGFKPFGYHLVNVLLHTLSTGLVVKLARHILPNGIGILIAGLLFASHPVHTEAVAGIVGRADLLACIFYVSTLLSYIRHVQWREKCDSRHWLTLCEAILYSSVAILCKETAISSLVVCIVYDILKGFNTFTRDKVKSLNFH
jgi:dolichyl-phosphate-mannose--protein O-mannosyl transferase